MLEFYRNLLSELISRNRFWLETEHRQLVADFVHCQGLEGRLGKTVDDAGRRLRRHEKADPCYIIIPGEAGLRQCRHIGERLDAPIAGKRYGFDLVRSG